MPLLATPPRRRSALTANANVLLVDPTRTTMIRKQFAVEIRLRIARFKKALREFLITLDALGLAPHSSLLMLARPQPREFQFLTKASKLTAFNNWVKQQIEIDILSNFTDWNAPVGSIAQGPWTVKYIAAAYRRGLTNAFLSSKKGIGAISASMEEQLFLREGRFFFDPELYGKVQLLATRAFENLRGVTASMATEMNRILADGMSNNRSVESIAQDMIQAINGLTEKRALMIARTETIHAHAEGQLDAFERMGQERLTIKAEWTTAGDDKVCPACAAFQGKVFEVEKAHGLIPLHPNCRCSWTPAF